MPELSQYQSVFRIAKPNSAKRPAHGPKPKKNEKNESSGDNDNVSKAQARLQKLEEMVTMLMQSNQGPAMPEPTDITTDTIGKNAPSSSKEALSASEKLSSSCPDAPANGHLDVRGAETKYHGSTHWAAILEHVRLAGIRELHT